MQDKFQWVNFYKSLALRLLDYKSDRTNLISIIKSIYFNTNINMPTLEKDNILVDIDPFTVFGLFNKSSIKESNRKAIASELHDLLGINSPVPETFESIPALNNLNATYYYFSDKRKDTDIDNLWNLFSAAIEYADSSTEENHKVLEKYFDIAVKMSGNGNSKITMALYWIAPETYLNLDSRNVWYIYESGKIPEHILSQLPEPEPKIAAKKYFEIIEKLKHYLPSEEIRLNDFKELSAEAYAYSKYISELRENTDNTQILQTANEVPNIKSIQKYTKENFLHDVYIDEKYYDLLTAKLERKKNIIIQGAPGVGKTYAARRLAYSVIGEEISNQVRMIQFHQSYSYEDFIMGYRPSENGFEIKTGAFYDFCKKAQADPSGKYFFIIDEINRGNISKIFGELFMLIEEDKRGISIPLMYRDEEFSVPENLYIIGMMNTADRSIAMIDYALRRRFSFFDLKPAFESEGFKKYIMELGNTKFRKLINCIILLNHTIENDDALGHDFCIGHSYFCNISPDEMSDSLLESIIDYDIIPLLSEYWFDEPSKVSEWSEKLRNSIK